MAIGSNFARGVLATIICFLIIGLLGITHLLGFLYPYFCSFFRQFSPQLHSEDMMIISVYFFLAKLIASPLAVRLHQMTSARFCFLFFIGLFLLYMVTASYVRAFWIFALVFGLGGGACLGAMLAFPLSVCWKYFKEEHKPLVSGILLAAMAFAPFGTSLWALHIVNPQNHRPSEVEQLGNGREVRFFDSTVSNNVPQFLREYGVLGSCVCLVLCIFIFDTVQEASEENEHLNETKEHKEAQDPEHGKESLTESITEAFRDRTSYSCSPVSVWQLGTHIS